MFIALRGDDIAGLKTHLVVELQIQDMARSIVQASAKAPIGLAVDHHNPQAFCPGCVRLIAAEAKNQLDNFPGSHFRDDFARWFVERAGTVRRNGVNVLKIPTWHA
jgi:hypothetical protein